MGQWKITAVHTQAAEKIYIRGEKRMGKEKITDQAMYDFYGKMPLKRAIPLGLQHVLAMFVGNLTPLRNQWKRGVRPSSGLSFTERDVCSGSCDSGPALCDRSDRR